MRLRSKMSNIEKIFTNSKNLTVKYAVALLEKEKCEKMLTLSYECQLQSDQVLAEIRPDPKILEFLLVERILENNSTVDFLRKQLKETLAQLKKAQERLTFITKTFRPLIESGMRLVEEPLSQEILKKFRQPSTIDCQVNK